MKFTCLYKILWVPALFFFAQIVFFPVKAAHAGPVTGKDDLGRTVTLKKPPQKIVLLSGSPIDVIYEIGAADLLVGVVDSIDDSYPETVRRYPSVLKKERVGRFSDPNIEKIVSLEPDLIFAFASTEYPGKFTSAFDKRGLVYAGFVSVESTAFGIEQIRRMGRLLCRDKEAEALAGKIRKEVDDLSRTIAATIKDRPVVYYWWGSRNGTYGRKSAIHELIGLAGGTNLTAEFDQQYMELSPEYVIAGDPDVIVISYFKETQKAERMAELRQRPGFANVKAVKNNRVFCIDGHSFFTPVRFASTIQTLAGYIHPELFKDTVKGSHGPKQ